MQDKGETGQILAFRQSAHGFYTADQIKAGIGAYIVDISEDKRTLCGIAQVSINRRLKKTELTKSSLISFLNKLLNSSAQAATIAPHIDRMRTSKDAHIYLEIFKLTANTQIFDTLRRKRNMPPTKTEELKRG